MNIPKLHIIGVIILVILMSTLIFFIYSGDETASPDDIDFDIQELNEGIIVEQTQGPVISEGLYMNIVYDDQPNEEIDFSSAGSNSEQIIRPRSDLHTIQQVELIYEYDGEETQIQSHIITTQESNFILETEDFIVDTNENLNVDIDDFVKDREFVDSYAWDTGFQVIEDTDMNQEYSDEGLYNTSLKITTVDNQEYNIEFDVIVTDNPIETSSDVSTVATYSPDESVQLSAQETIDTSENITSYQWYMGDGVERQGKSVTHTYNNIGNYIVELTVIYDDGTSSKTTQLIQIQENIDSSIDVEDSYGFTYEFAMNDNTPEDRNKEYTWFIDDQEIDTDTNTLEYGFDEYGIYNVTVRMEDEFGNIVQESINVETTVVIEMGEEPYTVEFVSGNYEEILLPNSDIGGENPEMAFQENHRYRIESIPVDTAFIDEDDEILLSQRTEGTFEDDEDVEWREISDDTVEFYVTSELGQELFAYTPYE